MIRCPGTTANVPRWFRGSGTRPGPGWPSCTGTWRLARMRRLNPAHASTTGGRLQRSAWPPPRLRGTCAARRRCCTPGGLLHLEQHRPGQGRQDFEAAGRLFRDVGDEIGLALVVRTLAIADRLSGRFEDAVRGFEQALAAFRKIGNLEPTVSVLLDLARLRLERGEHQAATESLADALGLAQGMPPGRVRAQALYVAGDASLAMGELDRAITLFDQALAIVCDIGDPVGHAHVLRGLGVARLRLGELGAARVELERALELAGSTGEQMAGGRALLGLSELALASDEPQQAAVLAQQASDAFQASMHPDHLTPENARTGRRPAKAEAAATSPATSPAAPYSRGTGRRRAAGPAASDCGFSGTGSA